MPRTPAKPRRAVVALDAMTRARTLSEQLGDIADALGHLQEEGAIDHARTVCTKARHEAQGLYLLFSEQIDAIDPDRANAGLIARLGMVADIAAMCAGSLRGTSVVPLAVHLEALVRVLHAQRREPLRSLVEVSADGLTVTLSLTPSAP